MVIYSLDPVMYGGMGSDLTMSLGPTVYSGLGEHPWMSSLQCGNFLKLVETYTRLSQKTSKKPATRANAERLAAQYQNDYNTCMERKADKAVTKILQPIMPPVQIPKPPVSVTPPSIPPVTLVPGETPQTGSPVMTTQPFTASTVKGWLTKRNMLIGAGVLAAVGVAVYMRKKGRRR